MACAVVRKGAPRNSIGTTMKNRDQLSIGYSASDHGPAPRVRVRRDLEQTLDRQIPLARVVTESQDLCPSLKLRQLLSDRR